METGAQKPIKEVKKHICMKLHLNGPTNRPSGWLEVLIFLVGIGKIGYFLAILWYE